MNNSFADYIEGVAKFQHDAEENCRILDNYIYMVEFNTDPLSRDLIMALMVLKNMNARTSSYSSGTVY